MKNIAKKAISMILAAVMMITMSFTAFAADIPVIDMGTFHNVYNAPAGSFKLSDWDYEYTNNDGTDYIVLDKYNGTDKEITIKGKVKKGGKEYGVLLGIRYDTETKQHHSLFENNSIIEKVTFESVDDTLVGCSNRLGADSLFKGCTTLKEVVFNDSLVAVGSHKLYSINGMFEGCTALEKADLSDLDLSECEEAERVFKGCTNVDGICLDGVDFRNLRTAASMFEGCTSLASADLSAPLWGNTEKNTNRMFAGDGKLAEITLPNDFEPSTSCAEMFQTDTLKKLTVKGNPSENFRNRVFTILEDNNRYLGEVSIVAHVDLDGADLEADMFEFTLYDGGIADDTVISTVKNDADGNISFGSVKVYDPSKPLEFVAAMTEDDTVTSETENLNKKITLELNEDGTLSVEREEALW